MRERLLGKPNPIVAHEHSRTTRTGEGRFYRYVTWGFGLMKEKTLKPDVYYLTPCVVVIGLKTLIS